MHTTVTFLKNRVCFLIASIRALKFRNRGISAIRHDIGKGSITMLVVERYAVLWHCRHSKPPTDS